MNTATTTSWRTSPYHRHWLQQQADRLFDFFQYTSLNPNGGFYELYDDGRPFSSLRQLHATTRMVHCFAIGHLMGRPGAAAMVDHGMEYIWRGHRDQRHGGYMWSLDDHRIHDDSKQAYGHAFVLLAAAGAKCVGHPLADTVLADVTQVLEERFWEASPGVTSEEYGRDWSAISDYRGQNSNMHLTEALMAAFEATGEREYLRKAESIAGYIIGTHAAALDYRVAEHFDAAWQIDNGYTGSDIFRPSGSTPGHWLEWARLLLQLWHLGGQVHGWMPEAADKLFRNAVTLGWDHEKGGFFYTLGWDNRPALRQKLWWPATEGIGAAAWLAAHSRDPFFEDWYRRIWGFSAMHFIDHERGGWHAELDEALKPKRGFFTGKPDIYHALQACLIPLYPAAGSLTKVIAEASLKA